MAGVAHPFSSSAESQEPNFSSRDPEGQLRKGDFDGGESADHRVAPPPPPVPRACFLSWLVYVQLSFRVVDR